jgi:hypothetical protein
MGYFKFPWRVGDGTEKTSFLGANTIIATYHNDEGRDWDVPIVTISYGIKDAEKLASFIVESCNSQALDKLPE